MATTRCKICRHPLSDQISIAKGVGPECAKKFAAILIGAGLTLEALQIPNEISTDSNVAFWLRKAEQALLARRRGDVERFKLAAKEAAKERAQRMERERLAEIAWTEELSLNYGWPVQAAA